MNQNNSEKETLLENLTLVHKGILLFLLIISGNYIGNLFSCRIQEYFDTSIFAKHSIGFISLYFFVMLAEPKLQELNPINTLLLSMPLYFYFLILAKSEASIFLIIIVLLVILMVSHVYENYIKKKENLSKVESVYLNKVNIIKKVLIGLIVVITLLGFLVYLGMKKIEYEDKFNFNKFLFGEVICKKNFLGKHPHFSIHSESLENHELNIELIILFIKKAFS